ncbi:MAG: hypothetical protein GTO18_20660 [Anaerolineales bacterium]|nr:hypothetical protein [Anaerolineales bacterium]
MRGKKVSRVARKEIDLIVLAARYDAEGGRLEIAQGRERRGPVWGDVRLFEREDLLDCIAEGKRVVAGRQAVLEGDFEVFGTIQPIGENDNKILVFEGKPSTVDELGVPLF